jgi:hypothetical protein
MSCLIKKITSIVDLPDMNPNWFSVTLITPLKRCSMILSHSFIVWLISLIPRYLVQLYTSPLFLKIGTKMLHLYSSDILFDWKIRLNNLMCQNIAMSSRVVHTSICITFGSIVLPPFIIFKAFLTSDS